MPHITWPYTPTDGTVLNVGSWRTGISGTVAGSALYGTLNGGLTDENLTAAGDLRSYHFKPGEGHRYAAGEGRETLDYYDDLGPSDQDSTTSAWIPIAGASTRLYVPWDANSVVYNIGIHYSVFRSRQTLDSTPAGAVTDFPRIRMAMFIDGTMISHTHRNCPVTAWAYNPTAAAQYLINRENVLSQHYDCVHVARSSDGDGYTTKGYHTVSMRLQIQKNNGLESLFPLYNNAAGKEVDHFVSNRFRAGIRRASIIALP